MANVAQKPSWCLHSFAFGMSNNKLSLYWTLRVIFKSNFIVCTNVGLITFVAVGPYKYMLFHIAYKHLTTDQLSFCPSKLFPQWQGLDFGVRKVTCLTDNRYVTSLLNTCIGIVWLYLSDWNHKHARSGQVQTTFNCLRVNEMHQ